ncbi:MAG: hypothetical protein R2834_14225 [Rhodothermales bacterium]
MKQTRWFLTGLLALHAALSGCAGTGYAGQDRVHIIREELARSNDREVLVRVVTQTLLIDGYEMEQATEHFVQTRWQERRGADHPPMRERMLIRFSNRGETQYIARIELGCERLLPDGMWEPAPPPAQVVSNYEAFRKDVRRTLMPYGHQLLD